MSDAAHPRSFRLAVRCAAGAIACLSAGTSIARQPVRPPAVPVDPVAAIVEAFRTHAIVALGEGPHTNEQAHTFRLALIRDPRFAAVVDDVVVESGSARYQEVIDTFVGAEVVPAGALRELRENTVGAAPVWDRPMYEELFHAVRDVNRQRPRERQMRVLLGDPPIDWGAVRTAADYRTWARQRDSHPADLIRREVLAKGRRALIVYGDGHFQARTERPGRSLAAILESGGASLFIITSTFADLSTVQPGVSSWRAPALALIKGTMVGAAPYELLFGPAPPVEYFRANPNIEDHYDAVLHLGPASSMTMAPLDYPRCTEPSYIRMRVERMVLAGSSPAVADRLAQECAAAGRAAGQAREERPAPPAYVASVKRSAPGSPTRMARRTGAVEASNMTVRMLLRASSGLQAAQVFGGPAWLDTDRFDILARLDAPAGADVLLTTVRAILAERFRLVTHTETRETPVYALVRSRPDGTPGPQLTPSALDCAALVAAARASGGAPPPPPSTGRGCGGRSTFGVISAGGIPISQLVAQLSDLVDRVVVDRTQLTGTYDLDLTWTVTPDQLPPELRAPGAPALPPGNPNAPALPTALEEQLGLKLEPRLEPVEILVIDRVEPLTEN